jgi:S1-C subfamily serine protease
LLILKEPGRDCGRAFAVTYNWGRSPLVDVDLAGDSGHKFLLDTGCNSDGNLAQESFRTALKNAALTVVGTKPVETVSGSATRRLGRLNQLSLGDFTVRGPVVGEAAASSLGLGFCSRFVITFDFHHDKLYLKKGKNLDRADAHYRSGLHILRKDGKVVVDSVEKDSAAEAAGLKAGDLLVKVDDVRADEMSLFQLRQHLCAEGKRICMRIRRGERETETVLALGRETATER